MFYSFFGFWVGIGFGLCFFSLIPLPYFFFLHFSLDLFLLTGGLISPLQFWFDFFFFSINTRLKVLFTFGLNCFIDERPKYTFIIPFYFCIVPS